MAIVKNAKLFFPDFPRLKKSYFWIWFMAKNYFNL